MKSVLQHLKNFKHWFKIKQVESGNLGVIKETNTMEKNSDIDTETPPKKKLCVEESEAETTNEKVRKRKMGLLMCYFGDNYHGMQKNSQFSTIEGELYSALIKAKYILESDIQKLYFQRTARTDKGVSAAKQFVSLIMAENASVETLNKHLPQDIRILSVRRVTKGFHCQNECRSRIYSYTLPTFALAPEFHEEYPVKYRVSQEALNRSQNILLSYVGTHNFHNFTSKRHFTDPSAKRYIMNFVTGEPFVHEGEEFVTLRVQGQSFILHQIRKMVGHMIAILKGITPPNIETDVWTAEKYSLPLAPGLGLMLEDVLFPRYNQKYENDGIHESLAFDDIADEVNNFKQRILNRMIEKEIKERVMFQWLLQLQHHSYLKTEMSDEKNEDKEVTVEEEENDKCKITC